MSADYTRVRRVGGVLARMSAEARDDEGARAIQAVLRKRGVPLQASGFAEALPRDATSRLPLVEEGQWPATPAFLTEEVGRTTSRFIEDAKNIALLAEKGVSARLGMLLHGAPGTGKSLLASYVAALLERPIYVVRLDSMISSRLGETAKNVRGVFEFMASREGVLFLDEMDAIAKVRDDKHELGELKRVVNTVLQGLDSLPDSVVVIGATNHPHLLDPAIWRRFPYKAELPLPDLSVRSAMWRHFLYANDDAREKDVAVLARISEGLSGADVENISLAARRREILDGDALPFPQLLLSALASRAGNPSLPDRRDLSAPERQKIAVALHKKANIKVSEIGRIMGVSRQMAHRYLKEDGNAE
ncbi:AAA family ATPase [Pararoseomonas indoligenes]|uniref:ATP-binding protein n=1 Tax=Roseomonas indoligenes TaxID=2820811 RepID=A0A940N488_9PROT|nr:ATP-binding protein [Pararoseomonas indoligenes]MBP0496500.1 ATP-binding protein [Pararoseomonas indoligenes]